MRTYTHKGERMRPSNHKESKGNICLVRVEMNELTFSYVDEKGIFKAIVLNEEERNMILKALKNHEEKLVNSITELEKQINTFKG